MKINSWIDPFLASDISAPVQYLNWLGNFDRGYFAVYNITHWHDIDRMLAQCQLS